MVVNIAMTGPRLLRLNTNRSVIDANRIIAIELQERHPKPKFIIWIRMEHDVGYHLEFQSDIEREEVFESILRFWTEGLTHPTFSLNNINNFKDEVNGSGYDEGNR